VSVALEDATRGWSPEEVRDYLNDKMGGES